MSGEFVTGKFNLKISGEPLTLEMTVPLEPVKPQRMLPVIQSITSQIIDICSDAVKADGKEISCKAGCGACCRQPVPISRAEAFHLAELVEAMPEPRRSDVKQRFAESLSRFREIGWFERFEDLLALVESGSPEFKAKDYMDLTNEYMQQALDCPFLEDQSCSIHPDRPIICREYLVTSPAEMCTAPTPETIERVPVFLKASKAVMKMDRDPRDRERSLLMAEALDHVEHSTADQAKRPGPEWAMEFISKLADTKDAVDLTVTETGML